MNRFLQIVLGAALAFNLAIADISVTRPVEETWRAGTQNAITWLESGSGAATPASLSITLMYGAQNQLQLVDTVAKSIPSSPATYNWFIPGTTKPGSQYVIRIGEGDNAKYSHYFTIDNPSLPPMTNYTNATPQSTATSNAESASSGGSDITTKNSAFKTGAGVVGAVGVITSFLLM